MTATYGVVTRPRGVARPRRGRGRGDPRWNQRSLSSAQLAHEYGLTDVDGSQPDVWRFLAEAREPVDGAPDDYR
jgi:hypothetical protein